MTKPRYTNADSKITLGNLRTAIRNGTVNIGGGLLRDAVASAFGIDKDAFNTENFAAPTLKRFAALFDVPKTPKDTTSLIKAWNYPSQDDYATALQNFINRRNRPWAHVTGQTAAPESLEALGVGNV